MTTNAITNDKQFTVNLTLSSTECAALTNALGAYGNDLRVRADRLESDYLSQSSDMLFEIQASIVSAIISAAKEPMHS